MQIPRGQGGEFALRARINGVTAPMVIDTGATSVVLTYETAKAIGLPLELLEYDVDVETAGGHTKAARLTLDRLAIGKLVERSVPALVVPHGQMKTNLLGMSFLDRLESWEVRADRLMLPGFAGCMASRTGRDRSHKCENNPMQSSCRDADRGRGRYASCGPCDTQRDALAQHVHAGARPDAVLGEMAAERARAGHARETRRRNAA